MRSARLFLSILTCIAGISLSGCKDDSGQNSSPAPTCLEDLEGCKIAAMTGSLQEIELSSKGFSDNLVRLNTPADMFAAISSGVADCCYLDSVCLIGGSGESLGIQNCFQGEPSGYYGFGFNKDNEALCRSFNAHLKKMKDDGSFDKLVNRYISGEFTKVKDPEYQFDPNGKVLNVGLANIFPFDYVRDGQWSGLDVELINSFCAGNGYRPVITGYQFASLIPAIVSGKADIICSAITINEERSRRIQFSDPYYFCSSCCFVSTFNPAVGGSKKSGSFIQNTKNSFVSNFIVEDRWKLVQKGLYETVIISLFSILLGAILGIGICALMFSKYKPVRYLTNSFCDLLGGIPILVLLMVMFYIVFVSTSLSGRAVAIIAFSINFACSIANVYYSGITSVDHGQTEAGLALGFSPLRTFINFVLPQAAKKILPLFKGEGVSLIKNSSIVGYIAIQDLTLMCDIIRSRTFDAFFPLIAISIIYLILCWAFGKFIDLLGKRILK